MVKRAGIAATPSAFNQVISQPSSSGGDAQAATMDALGREALGLRNRLQPLANEHAKDVAAENAVAGNFSRKMTLVEEDEAYNNAIEGAFQAKLATDVETTVSALVRDHPIGSPVETLQGQINAARDTYLKQAPSEYASSVGAAWDRFGGRATISVADMQKKKAINDASTAISDRMGVIEDRLSNADDLEAPDVKAYLQDWEASAAQLTNPLYGVDPAALEIKRAALTDKILMRGVVKQAEGIYDEKGLDASRDFLEGVRKDTSFSLPDAQRDAIYSEAWGNIRFKDSEIKRQAAERKAEQRAQASQYKADLSGRMQDAMLAFQNGLSPGDDAPKPEEVRRIFGDSRANIYEAAMGGAPLMAELKTATAPELNAIINEPKPDATKPGFKQSLADWERRQKSAGKLLNERREDPMKAHIDSGLIDGGDVGEAMQSDAAMGLFLRSRAIAAIDAGGDYGTKPNPLTKSEAAALGGYLDKVDGQTRAQFLARAAKSIGRDNVPAYRALVQQLKPGSAAFTMGGMVMSTGGAVGKVTADRAGSLLIAGDALLNPTKADKEASGRAPMVMPEDKDMRRIWTRETGTAYAGAGATEPQAYQAYRAAYAALANDAGVFSTDVDSKIAKEAAAIASGGVGKWGERDVLLPWGMKESDFQGRIEKGWPAISAAHPALKGTKAENWDLIAIGDGRYWLGSGNTFAQTRDGRNIELRVR